MRKETLMAMKQGLKTIATGNGGSARIGRFAYRKEEGQLFYLDDSGLPMLLDWPTVEKNEVIQQMLMEDLTHIAKYPDSAISDEAKALAGDVGLLQDIYDQLDGTLYEVGHRLKQKRGRQFEIVRNEADLHELTVGDPPGKNDAPVTEENPETSASEEKAGE